jgi:hypothetical protein
MLMGLASGCSLLNGIIPWNFGQALLYLIWLGTGPVSAVVVPCLGMHYIMPHTTCVNSVHFLPFQ